MAAEGDAIITFIFNGAHRDDIPEDVTHLIVHENITIIPAWLFNEHPNLVEVYCHQGVTKIEHHAFGRCRSLRRVIIPGVVIIERSAFYGCTNLRFVDCDKLEIVGKFGFSSCFSFGSINLPSAKIVKDCAFSHCHVMTEAVFGKDLEYIGYAAFSQCWTLESITIPVKNDLLIEDNTFKGCDNLKRVDLIEGEPLRDVTDALLLESWKIEVNEELDSINNQILPISDPGSVDDVGWKAIAIRMWIESVLRKIIHYKAGHRELLDEAANALQLSLPNDIVMNNVIPFVELPAHTSFGGEDEADE